MSSKFQYLELGKTDIQVLDGDRGKNYPKQSDFINHGFCIFLSAKNVTLSGFSFNEIQFISEEKDKELRKGKLCRNDIILTTRGTLGNVAFYDNSVIFENLRINSGMVIVRSSSKWSPKYLYYIFSSSDFQNQILSLTSGSAVPQLPIRDLNKIRLPYTELNTQEKIVSFMDAITNKISLNNQINETLEAMAQAIFKSWFIDFDPVKAKMKAKEQGLDADGVNRAAMRIISSKTDPELEAMKQASPEDYNNLENIASHFPEELVESELGLIPKGWEVSILSELVTIIGGGTPKRSEASYWNGEIPWFSIKDLPEKNNIFVINTDEKITDLGLKRSSTKLLRKGTTIITARGTVGKLALLAIDCCMNQSCYGVQGKEVGDYYNYFNLKQAVSSLQQNVHGAVFDTITTKTFDTYKFAYSNLDLINLFEKFITSLMNKLKNNVYQNLKLEELRDSLLPKLLSGEIEV